MSLTLRTREHSARIVIFPPHRFIVHFSLWVRTFFFSLAVLELSANIWLATHEIQYYISEHRTPNTVTPKTKYCATLFRGSWNILTGENRRDNVTNANPVRTTFLTLRPPFYPNPVAYWWRTGHRWLVPLPNTCILNNNLHFIIFHECETND